MIPPAVKMIYRAAFWHRKMLSWMDADECNVMLEEDIYDNVWACLAPNSAEIVSPRLTGDGIYTPYIPLIVSKPLEYIKVNLVVTNGNNT